MSSDSPAQPWIGADRPPEARRGPATTSIEIIAHRGASGHHGDNTIAAYQAATSLGATWVELDVRRLGDGGLVVSHDPTTADGRRLIDCGVEVLQPAPEGHGLVGPDEAFDACGSLGVNVEIKNSPTDPDFDPDLGVVGTTMEVLARRIEHGDERSWLVSSFHAPTLRAARRYADEHGLDVPTAVLTSEVADASRCVTDTVEGGHVAIHPSLATVSEALIETAHAAGLIVNVWTVNEPEDIEQLLAWGVDGIVTDYPDRVGITRSNTSGR